MRFGKWTGCTAVGLGLLSWCAVVAQESASKPVAGLVSELSGEASIVLTPGGKSVRAQRFDTIAVGAIFATGPKSHAVIVLAGGQRFELGANARATITVTQLASRSGPVKELPSFPPLPKLVALDDSRPAGAPGGVRLRDTSIGGLRPSHFVTLAERTVIRFDPVGGASRYAIEIENEAGKRVFTTESTSQEVVVPPGVLEPQRMYYWSVQTLDKVGATARGTSGFRTLSAENAQLRRTLRQSVESEGDANALAFVAEVDRRLGLYEEALDEFRAVLARTPDDAAIQAAVGWLEKRGGTK